MKFQRINEDTVRCIVYKKDMQEHGIALEDFFKDKGKVHDFLHEIVERAEQEVGYIPKEGMLSMQIIPISPNTISITFSESIGESYDDIMNNLKDALLAGEEEELSEDGEEEEEVYYDDSEEDIFEENKISNGQESMASCGTPGRSPIVLIGMSSINKMAQFCQTLDINKIVTSELYYLKSKDMYFLLIEKKRLSEADMRRILVLALEYTSKVTNETSMICHVREYGEPIIKKSAYRILRNYV